MISQESYDAITNDITEPISDHMKDQPHSCECASCGADLDVDADIDSDLDLRLQVSVHVCPEESEAVSD